MRIDSQHFSFFKKRGFGFISVAIFLGGLNSSLFAPYLSLFGKNGVGMGPLALGIFLALSSFSAVVSSTVIARISDIVSSRKAILMLIMVAGIIGYSIYAFSRDYWILLFTTVFILGISTSSFPQLFAYARETVVSGSEKTQVMTNTVLRSFFSIAWVVGPLIGVVLFQQYSFFGLYGAVAVNYGLLLVLIVLFAKKQNGLQKKEKTPMVFNRSIVCSSLSFVFIFVATSMGMYALPLFLTESLGGDASHIGYLFSVAAAVEIPLMIVGGFLAGYFGKQKLLKVGYISFLLYALLLLLVNDPIWLYPIQLLNGIAVAQIMGVGISYFQDLNKDQPGTTTTLFSNSTKLGNVLGGVLFGAIIFAFDYRIVFVFSALFAVAAFILLHYAATLQQTGRTDAIYIDYKRMEDM